MKQYTCCFTGHRPPSLPWGYHEEDPRCVNLKHRLKGEILCAIHDHDIHYFLSGMAQGVDLWAAEIVLELQREYSISLECVLPCCDQAAHWPYESRRRYRSILQRCNQVTLLQPHYTPDCFQRRNRYLVDHSSVVLAVWNGSASGTGSTVQYARRTGKLVYVIAPQLPLPPGPLGG